jgi:hypothetical protein
LQFFVKKIKFFFSCKFFPIFGHQNLGSGSGSDIRNRIRIQIRIDTNADPQHWKEEKKKIYKLSEQDFTDIFRAQNSGSKEQEKQEKRVEKLS